VAPTSHFFAPDFCDVPGLSRLCTGVDPYDHLPMDDAELVAAARAGRTEAFGEIYDRYADRIHDFCAGMLRDRDEAADAMQDTFVATAQRLDQLREPDKLRAWLYAIARNESLRRLSARRRSTPTDTGDLDRAATGPGPEDAVTDAALRDLVASAAAGLADRDRALLDLNLRQGLEGQELADAMGVSPSHARVLMDRLRDRVERSLGALLVARLGRKDCAELRTMLADWDGTFSPLIRKRVARHVDDCAVCGDRRKKMVSPMALLSAVPLIPAPIVLRPRTVEAMEHASAVGPPKPWGRDGFPPGGAGVHISMPLVAAVAGTAAVVAAAVVGVVLVVGGGDGNGDGESVVASAPPATEATTPPTEPLVTEPPTTAAPVPAPPPPCTSPNEAAQVFHDAWANGDQEAAGRCATQVAIETLFGGPSGPAAGEMYQGCQSTEAPTTCAYSYEGGAIIFNMAVSDVSYVVESVEFVAD